MMLTWFYASNLSKSLRMTIKGTMCKMLSLHAGGLEMITFETCQPATVYEMISEPPLYVCE